MYNSLETREGLRPTPLVPKNPYNGKNFNIYELKLMYDFLVNNPRPTLEPGSSHLDDCY